MSLSDYNLVVAEYLRNLYVGMWEVWLIVVSKSNTAIRGRGGSKAEWPGAAMIDYVEVAQKCREMHEMCDSGHLVQVSNEFVLSNDQIQRRF